MRTKLRAAILIIAFIFIVGGLSVFLGFSKGNDMASFLSRPKGAIWWTVKNELIIGCTYTPVIVGISLIILALILSIILFYKWLKN
jgi:uncharacterized protein YpmB